MKLAYIAGLEHSGTTLLSHFLSTQPGVLALGELSQFFSPEHMHQYMEKWGSYDDCRRCSCGSDWHLCEFWSGIHHLCGLESSIPLLDKYQALIEHIRERRPQTSVIVDSSKSLNNLDMLTDALAAGRLDIDRMFVINAIKDIRNFTSSVGRKSGLKKLKHRLRTFNWWLAYNRSLLERYPGKGVTSETVFYETFCKHPDKVMRRLARLLGVNFSGQDNISGSHIALGNKDFTVRNIHAIRYDERWQAESNIRLAYRLHLPARRFNSRLYFLADNDSAATIVS